MSALILRSFAEKYDGMSICQSWSASDRSLASTEQISRAKEPDQL